MSSFSETLRRIRFERHMTQEEFADLLGTTKQNISRYEAGTVSPKISTAAAIAKKLGISISELSGESTRQDTSNEHFEATSKANQWKILSKGFDKMPEEDLNRIIKMLSAAYPEFFNEGDDVNES